MKYKPLPIGISDFAEIIDKKCYYVDKTLLIRELLDNTKKVTLFTRPRRFGKTLNMSMLKYFFEDDRDTHGQKRDWSQLFEGLNIVEAGKQYLSHMGQYPVIYLTFKDAKRESFEESYRQLEMVIADEFSRHDFLLDSIESEKNRGIYKAIVSEKAEQVTYQNAIRFLSRCLETYYGRKPIVLIDEYDVPLENAWTRGFYDKMINFIRALFESGLKDNTSLEFAVITGGLRVSKESNVSAPAETSEKRLKRFSQPSQGDGLFTGMNNLSIISIRNAKYDEYFGFKPEEVQQLCHYYDMDEEYKTVQDWYDGYTFGQTDIYNPWSVIQYIDDARANTNWLPMAYWANTSSNSIVRTLIDHSDDDDRMQIEELLSHVFYRIFPQKKRMDGRHGHLCGTCDSQQGSAVYFRAEGTGVVP